MSHDTDKLIRQLSLVAFLMAERRPLTARDIKSNVEGYQEMSDEAFARRFYSDRAELVSLGVPLDSQRDEFTGEELYALRSERYFLPELELDDEELAALQTCFYLLEGRFAYAEPLRLALQNLALGRSAGMLEAAPTGTAVRVEVRDPDYSPELQGRLGQLEGAISKQRTVRFKYSAIYRDHEAARTVANGTAARATSSGRSTGPLACSRAGSCARTAARCRCSRRSCAGSRSGAPARRVARTKVSRPPWRRSPRKRRPRRWPSDLP